MLSPADPHRILTDKIDTVGVELISEEVELDAYLDPGLLSHHNVPKGSIRSHSLEVVDGHRPWNQALGLASQGHCLPTV